MPLAYLIATVVTGLGLLIGSHIYVSYPVQVARISVPSVVAEPKAVYVGRITGMVDCKGTGVAAASRGVPLGRKYELASGWMEITYDTGAKVILQGPVTYDVESNGGFLSIGKLTGKLEKRGERRGDRGAGGKSEIRYLKSEISNPQSLIPNPFVIRTPTATITDLGTEFGVEVDRESSARIYVFDGAVRVSDPDHRQDHVAHAGETVQANPGGIRRVASVNAPQRFVRTIRQQELSPMFTDDFTGGPSRRWMSTFWADFTHNNARFTDVSAPDRGYVRTIYSEYGTRDFIATVKLTNAQGPTGSVLFGIGDGVRNCDYYYEPNRGECIYMFYAGSGWEKIGRVHVYHPVTTTWFSREGQPAGTTIGVQLIWVAATGTATFKLDLHNNGRYEDDAVTVSNPKLSLAENPTRLFFGGTHGVVVDDFAVTSPAELSADGSSAAQGTGDSRVASKGNRTYPHADEKGDTPDKHNSER